MQFPFEGKHMYPYGYHQPNDWDYNKPHLAHSDPEQSLAVAFRDAWELAEYFEYKRP